MCLFAFETLPLKCVYKQNSNNYSHITSNAKYDLMGRRRGCNDGAVGYRWSASQGRGRNEVMGREMGVISRVLVEGGVGEFENG